MRNNGLFVVFEGGEGSGKSTQARLLARALHMKGVPHLLTREPGDSNLGAELRSILLDSKRAPISRKAEALLFAADRAEHVENVVFPALKQGMVVICDRYIGSSVAYQAYGGGLTEEAIRNISNWASDSLQPDVTYYLDISPEVGLERARRVERTRFEDKDVAYHTRVQEGFMAQMDESWLIVDATQSVDDVHEDVYNHLMAKLIVHGRRMPDPCPCGCGPAQTLSIAPKLTTKFPIPY